METKEIIARLKERGARITKIRQSMVGVFLDSARPLTAGEVIESLNSKKSKINKTTVYRELDFLEKENIIAKVRLADGETRYEPAALKHHHHLFCVKCKGISPIKLETPACSLESVTAAPGFRVLGHSIELFGLCAQCQKTKSNYIQ